MATLSELLPDVHIEAPNCHVGLIRKQLQATVRHFCKETYYWQHDLPAITLLPFNGQAPGTYLYELDIPEGSEILGVKELLYEQRPMAMKSTQWLDEEFPNWREQTGDPRYYLMLSDRRVRFVPASDEVQPIAVTGTVILQPSRKAEDFGDDLLQYDQGLVHGALFRLLAMANKPWSDPQRAQVCQIEYVEAISQAKHEAMRDWSTGAETMARRSWL